MTGFLAPPRRRPLPIAFRFALRELRGGFRGFAIFILCIALGVMAIAGVNSVRRAMTETITAEGRVILGGDMSVSLIGREADAAEAAYLAGLGRVSTAGTVRAMARRDQGIDQALVELKAVDGAYPLYGTLTAEIADGSLARDPAALMARQADGSWGALAEMALLVRLDVKIGDRLRVGNQSFTLTGIIRSEPDKVAGGVGFGPRLMMSGDGLRDTGLVQPGSLVRWLYRIQFADDRDPAAVQQAADERFPQAGWEIRSRSNAAPGLRNNIDRFAQFLTLVGVTALVVGGVGVGNAVRAYLEGKREVIATLKCLGATGGFVFTLYFLQIMAIAAVGVVLGLAAGTVMPWAAAELLSAILPMGARAAVYPSELLLAVAYGFLTAAAFAVIPLGRAHDIPPTALFRDGVEPDRRLPRPRYLIAAGGLALALVALALLTADDRRIAILYVGALAATFLMLRMVATGIMAIARRVPARTSTELRLAVRNIHRPGAATPSVVLSLGLGLTLLVTLALVDANLRRQLDAQLPKQAPSFFFLDLPNREVPAFSDLVARAAPEARLERVPMLRGRIVAIDGRAARDITPDREFAWVLNGDRGITYSEGLPENSRLSAGEWWPKDYSGPPLVSFDARLGRALGMEIGSRIRVNVLGREFEARVGNFRTVEWESLAINFVMVFSPNTFRGAPHSFLATVAWPDGGSEEKELGLLRQLTQSFPTVTSIRVKDALKAVDDLVGRLADGIAAAASVTVVSAILVLAGALAAGQRRRIYDAVILKTLGATRRRLLLAFALEYGLLGLSTAIFGLLAGSIAAWYVLTRVMNLGFGFDFGVALAAVVAALVATLGFGLLDTARALGAKAAPVLRHL